jgi:hypothetical protein
MKRDPLDKTAFMKSVRQQWCAIFILCAFIVLFVNVYIGVSFDPTSYMQFFLAIGSLFILGASGDSWVKAYSVKSIKETEVKEETKRSIKTTITKDDTIVDQNIVLEYRNEYSDDTSYAPLEWIEKTEQSEFR